MSSLTVDLGRSHSSFGHDPKDSLSDRPMQVHVRGLPLVRYRNVLKLCVVARALHESLVLVGSVVWQHWEPKHCVLVLVDLLHVRDVELQVRRITFTMNSFQSTMSRPYEVKYMPLGDLVQLVAGVGNSQWIVGQ